MDFGGPHSVAHQFNPVSLRIARELRGYLKNELAAKLELTPSAITQFESGLARPNAATLARLAVALGFPVAFFGRRLSTSPVSTDQCHFRSVKTASQRERRAMLAAATLLRELVDYIDDRVHLPPENITSFVTSVDSAENIEALTVKIRSVWGLGLGPIPDLVGLLEANGLVVFKLLSTCERVDAFSFWHNQRPFAFLNAEKDSPTRTRFDAAHELGHLIMHIDCAPGDKQHESEAHRFASAFLLPREAVLPELPRRVNWAHLFELKRRWGVSVAALLRRAFDLGVISRDAYGRANRYIAFKGWKTSEPSEPVPEFPSLISDGIGALAAAGTSMAEIADQLGVTSGVLDDLVASQRPWDQPPLPFSNIHAFKRPRKNVPG
jgi:Zn-dependent peptidase ImmA (M78 family)/transcriptional regulator with XRE-family HTH domain